MALERTVEMMIMSSSFPIKLISIDNYRNKENTLERIHIEALVFPVHLSILHAGLNEIPLPIVRCDDSVLDPFAVQAKSQLDSYICLR